MGRDYASTVEFLDFLNPMILSLIPTSGIGLLEIMITNISLSLFYHFRILCLAPHRQRGRGAPRLPTKDETLIDYLRIFNIAILSLNLDLCPKELVHK